MILTLVKILFHVVLIFWVEKVVAALSEQISWNVTEDVHDALVNE